MTLFINRMKKRTKAKDTPQLRYYYRNQAKIAKKARLMRLLFKLQSDIEAMDTLKEKYDKVQKIIANEYNPKEEAD